MVLSSCTQASAASLSSLPSLQCLRPRSGGFKWKLMFSSPVANSMLHLMLRAWVWSRLRQDIEREPRGQGKHLCPQSDFVLRKQNYSKVLRQRQGNRGWPKISWCPYRGKIVCWSCLCHETFQDQVSVQELQLLLSQGSLIMLINYIDSVGKLQKMLNCALIEGK